MFLFIVVSFFKFLSVVVPVLLSVAYLTLAERKTLASIQRRRGPSLVGIFGLLQPLSDGIKLFLKESIVPMKANYKIFIFSPIAVFSLSLMGWGIIPFGDNKSIYANLDLSVLYIFLLSSLTVYGIIMAGWSSNSKYAFLGSIRSAAQMISYEVSIGIIVLNIGLCVQSLNFIDIIEFQGMGGWFVFFLYPIFFMFFISCIAETNRAPFDLPEAESELVSGYNVEYSAVGFALFFIGEYANIILMSLINVILFCGGWYLFNDFVIVELFFPYIFFLKLFFFLFLFVWIRSALPRYRYDQLMNLCWKVFLPLSLSFFICYSFIYFIIL